MSVLSCRNSYSWACCCSVRFGWGWLLTEVAEGEGLGGVQMVWLCKSSFLLNKRIRFCSASNLFSCIHLLRVCARTMAGFPPALPSPSHCATLSGGNGLDPCMHLCPPLVCPRQPFGTSLLHQSVQFTGERISSALVCYVWPEAGCLCVTRLLQHCWKYQSHPGHIRNCLWWAASAEHISQVLSVTAASIQVGIKLSNTWMQKRIKTEVSWSFQKHCKF